jgi:hypothetical protein
VYTVRFYRGKSHRRNDSDTNEAFLRVKKNILNLRKGTWSLFENVRTFENEHLTDFKSSARMGEVPL